MFGEKKIETQLRYLRQDYEILKKAHYENAGYVWVMMNLLESILKKENPNFKWEDVLKFQHICEKCNKLFDSSSHYLEIKICEKCK